MTALITHLLKKITKINKILTSHAAHINYSFRIKYNKKFKLNILSHHLSDNFKCAYIFFIAHIR